MGNEKRKELVDIVNFPEKKEQYSNLENILHIESNQS